MSHADAIEKTSLAGMAMAVVGGLNLIFWLAWAVWGLGIVVLQGGAAAFVLAMDDGGNAGATIFQGLLSILTQGCNGFTSLLLAVGAGVAILGGLRLRQVRSKGLVYVGVVALVLGPLISILVGAGAAVLSFSCCGLLFGQLPTLVLFLVNAGAGVFVVMSLQDPVVAEAFAAGDQAV